MAQSDLLPTMQYSSFPGDGWYVPATATSAYQCPRCGQWVFGGAIGHTCNPPNINWTFYPPVSAPPCHHCYCIDVPPSGERTKPHHRCCKCSDVRVRER